MPTFNLGQINSNYIYLLFIVAAVVLVIYAMRRPGEGNLIDKLKPGSSSGPGNTPFLNQYCVDFTQMARNKRLDPVIGREEEVKKLSQVLSRRTKNNAILIGDPGVGKTAIVEGLAQRIVAGDVPEHLLNKRMLALDVTTLMAGTKYRGEFEQRAKKIVQEITSSNRSIILFIDEVHSVIQSKGTEGAINFSDILKPALARGDLQMVGATTTLEYEQYIKSDASLERRFQPIEVFEPSPEETIQILQGVKDKYREYHKVEFTDAALEIAATLSRKLIADRKLPDKAIDALDESAAMVKVSHLHSFVDTVLYQAAIAKHPEVAGLWDEIQKLDKEILKTNDTALVSRREELEKQIDEKGIVTVDSADVEKVINDWVK